MKRIQIFHRRFDSPHIFFSERATDVQDERGDRHAMINHAKPANDNEFKTAVPEPHEQRLVILRHELGLTPEVRS